MIHMNHLNHAAMKGHNGVISLLLSKGISIDVSNGFGSPLHLACAFGQHDTVNLLLDHNACAGADTNGGPDGVKALPLAAKVGIIQIIKLLVEAGAGPNFTDMCGLKSVKEAALDGNRQGVEIHFPEHMWMGALMGWQSAVPFFHAMELGLEIDPSDAAVEEFVLCLLPIKEIVRV
ncbi:ankyrin repeat and SOCS box protein 13-like [Papaver somniferum]|uniref:ankyrin repeat and SOCS box protein 13-like n=1 Tax=Papaver somniferum TaxID=3469 RepID=UPI000E6F50F2|nr:ankyrin repeat and SOCS box protein 13-like [Papaver somniferum]